MQKSIRGHSGGGMGTRGHMGSAVQHLTPLEMRCEGVTVRQTSSFLQALVALSLELEGRCSPLHYGSYFLGQQH